MRRDPEVHSITSVQRALSEDVDDRMKRYAFSMAVRTVCILIAILVPGPGRWIAIAGAVVIPMIAVLVANAGRELPPDSQAVTEEGALDVYRPAAGAGGSYAAGAAGTYGMPGPGDGAQSHRPPPPPGHPPAHQPPTSRETP